MEKMVFWIQTKFLRFVTRATFQHQEVRVAQYLEACTLEEQASTAVEAGKKALGTRSYAVALEEFKKVPQGSTQYEYAQGQARDARREATSALLIEARNLSLTDAKQAMAKIEEGLAISPEHPGLKALKESVRGGNTVAALPKDNPPPPPPVREPKEPKQPKIKKQPKEVKVAAQPTPPPAGGAGDLKSVGPALSAYKARNFGGALNAMQNFVKVNTGPAQAKARAVVKDIEELKGLIDKGTPDALTKAQALDRRISGGELAAFLADKRPSRAKRDSMIDRLIGSPEFVDYWTNKWADLLQVNRKFLGEEGAVALRNWIKNAVATNLPYDQFARAIITASGSNVENPPAAYFKTLRQPQDLMEIWDRQDRQDRQTQDQGGEGIHIRNGSCLSDRL